MALTYKYESLPKNNIRFIALSPELEDGRPQLSLISCARTDAPEYVCMSYCWGQDLESESIYLDGQQFGSNVDEKTEQVSRMEETYRNATTIAAWLGKPEESQNKERTGRDHTSKLSSPSFVDEIISSPYWSRMWIVQELILARTIILLYGHLRLPWKGVNGVMQAWSTFGKSKWRHSPAINLVFMTVGAQYTRKYGRALGELMRYLEHSEATDPRDRVFALIGLMEGEERRLLGMIFPDYTMSHEKVVLVTMAYLKQIYAPSPFKWVVKPQQVWNRKVFGLEKETWEALWKETEGYETPHDLTNYASVPGQSAETFRGQKG
ncbi:HET-domain-containing protein [Hypoxylon sp. NC0597]|nr:HET-domain-containing protein [Hypoxylon sp. NC0597]